MNCLCEPGTLSSRLHSRWDMRIRSHSSGFLKSLRKKLRLIIALHHEKRRLRKEIKRLDNIDKKISDSELIINNLLSYSRLKPPTLKKIRIHDVVNDYINSNIIRCDHCAVSVIRDLSSIENVICEVAQLQIGAIINNIMNNSFQAI